ncbi:hypothetical protein QYE76_029516 [Lolium multiflorum]|uniref:Leucine zipper homeobox-associated domain-containing protein n=1 Tax=Lolium multiflorum TaxID=4521 RepID=A0AAD8QN07_LOLMU|nr:hypothetical protein QYE76_029516 [Lolium multiflorum]
MWRRSGGFLATSTLPCIFRSRAISSPKEGVGGQPRPPHTRAARPLPGRAALGALGLHRLALLAPSLPLPGACCPCHYAHATSSKTKLKRAEVDYDFMKHCCEVLTEENRLLQKEVYEKGPSIARGAGQEAGQEALDMKISHGRAWEEREACAKEEEVQDGARPDQTGRHAGAPGPTRPQTGRAQFRPESQQVALDS